MSSLSMTTSRDASDVDAADVVSASSLGLTLGHRRVLRQIELVVPRGEFIGLIGANGAGKSTLLSLLATLVSPTQGTLKLFGQTVTRNSTAVRARIGMIGHRPMLYRDLTARENLMLFAKLYGLSFPADRVAQMLGKVKLADRADDVAGTFSRGMMQRLAIARALLHDPELLLTDEPFSGLDIPSSDALEQLLRGLHAEGCTIVLAHHDLPHAFGLVDRLAVLRRGELVMDAAVRHVDIEQVRREVIGS